jgi:hypothetical protein
MSSPRALSARNKEVQRSADEVIRTVERSSCGGANGAALPDGAKSGFTQHLSQRMHQASNTPPTHDVLPIT